VTPYSFARWMPAKPTTSTWRGSPKLRKVWCLRSGGDLCCAPLGSDGLQELSSLKSETPCYSEM
jgi:hypothetical protein